MRTFEKKKDFIYIIDGTTNDSHDQNICQGKNASIINICAHFWKFGKYFFNYN